MLEGVHSQPNFSPPNKRITKKTQIFRTFPQNFKLFYPSILTQPDMFVLTLTDDKLFKFVLILGEEKRNFEFFGVFL